MTDAMALPDDIVAWIEDQAGGPVTSAERVPGGASREAWFVDVERADGTSWPLFLRYSRVPDPGDREITAFLPMRVEGEVFMALQGTDVTVPRTLAVHPTQSAILAERVSGGTWFYRIQDPGEAVSTAQDFIKNLAALHRLDPRKLDLPSFGAVMSAREHALDELDYIRRRLTRHDGTMDPMYRFAIGWLERNVPDWDGPTCLVQGDTGPGNFMYENGKVTAVVDWELAHFGDPMDDIAWLSLRTVQDTFTHFPDRIREYEQLSGIEVDERRVWYYRLFAEMRMASLRAQPKAAPSDEPSEKPKMARDVGNGLIYGMLHRRLAIDALAAVLGLDLEPATLPDDSPAESWHHLYDDLLDNLSVIVPRIEDPLASQWTKGAARVVKYLKELDLNGRRFIDAEIDDVAGLVGSRADSAADARAALVSAVEGGTVSEEDYVRFMWRQVQRDDHLLRGASGRLRERTWPALRD
jgi:aminoglycoside phosphotransferase (APT) family kinase protein